MSIRQGLLALLASGPMYGAQLRSEFEVRTGGTWPLNVGQVYTTLGRLERDGLVEGAGERDDEGKIAYRLTDAGSEEVRRWWASPVDRSESPRDELVIKLALAVTLPGVDVTQVVQTQRMASLRRLQDLTRLKAEALRQRDIRQLPPGGKPPTLDTAKSEPGPSPEEIARADHAWRLVLENLIFVAEAEARWLDHVEGDLARLAATPGGARASAAVSTADHSVLQQEGSRR